MALPKRVMRRGSHYKGYKLSVVGSGDNVLNITFTQACAVNGISLTPDDYDGDDYMTLEHIDSNGNVVKTLGETIYNIGSNVSTILDFMALELFTVGETLRLTYSSANGVTMTVHALLERIDSAKDN